MAPEALRISRFEEPTSYFHMLNTCVGARRTSALSLVTSSHFNNHEVPVALGTPLHHGQIFFYISCRANVFSTSRVQGEGVIFRRFRAMVNLGTSMGGTIFYAVVASNCEWPTCPGYEGICELSVCKLNRDFTEDVPLT